MFNAARRRRADVLPRGVVPSDVVCNFERDSVKVKCKIGAVLPIGTMVNNCYKVVISLKYLENQN